jgi:hypothetical protein
MPDWNLAYTIGDARANTRGALRKAIDQQMPSMLKKLAPRKNDHRAGFPAGRSLVTAYKVT